MPTPPARGAPSLGPPTGRRGRAAPAAAHCVRGAGSRWPGTGSTERDRTLQLLERQRTSLHDLLVRRQTLLAQLDSAGLALQNLKLDLLKLRSAGMSAAVGDGMSATQEARSVQRDIRGIMEAADDLRQI